LEGVNPMPALNLSEELVAAAIQLMTVSNQLYDKYKDNESIIANLWRPLSFYSTDIINKSNILKESIENVSISTKHP
jgi:hypothetical protein